MKMDKIPTSLSYGYYRIAQQGLGYILSASNYGKIVLGYKRNRIENFTLEMGALFMAVNYNFRHALEISMKGLLDENNQSIPNTHKLTDLLSIIETEFYNKRLLSDDLWMAWEWLIKKYSEYDPYANADGKNELSRFMVSAKRDKRFAYADIHRLKRKDLDVFLRDIKTEKNLTHRMESEIQTRNAYLNNGWDLPTKPFSKTIICKSKTGYYTRQRKGVYKSKMLDT